MLQESSKQVEDIIKFLKPEVFFLFDIKLFLTLIFFVHIFMMKWYDSLLFIADCLFGIVLKS
jgi:hypothetical protein